MSAGGGGGGAGGGAGAGAGGGAGAGTRTDGGAGGAGDADESDLRVGGWAELGTDAARVRQAVFVIEQGIPAELEWDEWDARSIHAVAYRDGAAVATGRLLPDAHIGRMAVLAEVRGQGLGGRVLARLMQIARRRGDRRVELNAQTHVCGFYAGFGFEPVGEAFVEVGIPHRTMRRTLDDA